MPEPLVASGAIIAYRLLDGACAIYPAKAEVPWAWRMRSVGMRAQLTSTSARVPPVEWPCG